VTVKDSLTSNVRSAAAPSAQRSEPTKNELTRNELAKNELAKNELAKNELTRNELTRNEPTKETGVPELDRDTARDWIERWDRQQEESLPDREDRFTALIDAVEDGTGRPDPLVLDIGCGPGSIGVRLLDRLPRATVIGIDADPVSLALGRAAYQDVPGLRFVDLDLRVPGWSARLGLNPPSRAADAAVSTTALHWLPEPDLRAMYAELAAILRPGGLLLDGDHFRLDAKESPTLARLDLALRQREDLRRFPRGHTESWSGWWEAAAADPALADHVAERQRRQVDAGHHGGTQSSELATHVDALRAAGFAEIGTLWQRGDNRLLCAVRPTEAD
jgi:SAM-dependent methyltransferase